MPQTQDGCFLSGKHIGFRNLDGFGGFPRFRKDSFSDDSSLDDAVVHPFG
jgi:hypothetical protein